MRNNICFILISLIINSPHFEKSIFLLYFAYMDSHFIIKINKPTFDIYSKILLIEKLIYNQDYRNYISIKDRYGL